MYSYMSSGDNSDQELIDAFNIFDKNGDGHISFQGVLPDQRCIVYAIVSMLRSKAGIKSQISFWLRLDLQRSMTSFVLTLKNWKRCWRRWERSYRTVKWRTCFERLTLTAMASSTSRVIETCHDEIIYSKTGLQLHVPRKSHMFSKAKFLEAHIFLQSFRHWWQPWTDEDLTSCQMYRQ